jgi:subfamily B ATP-binding cassette protein HlyB/CyaB
MVILIAFETAFGYLRRFLVLHIVQRLDARLSTHIFDKDYPASNRFFRAYAQSGFVVRDINEIHKIRNFLTSSLFGTILDSFVLIVFLPIMFLFSPLLTFGVLFFRAVDRCLDRLPPA